MLKFYVYRHIRLDNNTPFYIGVGTKKLGENSSKFSKFSSEYERAFKKSGRNNLWKSIERKTQYRVEIIFESDSHEEVKNKEIEFIALYKRRLDGGTLANLTLGGEGVLGINRTEAEKRYLSEVNKGKIISEETRIKLRQAMTGRKMSEEAIEKMRNWVRKPMTQDQKAHLSKIRTGKKMPEEVKEKLRAKDYSYLHTKENALKSSKSRMGKYRGEKCWNSKLNNETVRIIKYEYIPNFTDREIAKKFNVSIRTINKIRKQETWKDI